MITTAHPAATQPKPATKTCKPADRVTKSLLGYGVVAGPLYVAVSLAQAATRDGFDLARHQWSLLALPRGGLLRCRPAVALAARPELGRRLPLRSGGVPRGFRRYGYRGGGAAANIVFSVAVAGAFGWLSAVSVHLYRRVGQPALSN